MSDEQIGVGVALAFGLALGAIVVLRCLERANRWLAEVEPANGWRWAR